MGVCREPRTRAAALSAALFAFGVSTARANGESQIPPECGSRAAFDQALIERLGPDAPLDQIALVITHGAARSHLRVQVGAEVRELEDPSCIELFRAALVVTVAMLGRDPARLTTPDAPPPPQASSATAARYPKLSLGAGAGIHVGTLPHPVPAFEIEAKALWDSLGLALGLRYALPATKTTTGPSKSVELRAFGVAASGIFRPSRLWEARLGFSAQRLAGEGSGNTLNDSDTAWAAGPSVGLSFIPVQRGAFWAGVGAEGQLNALRGRFEILNYYQPDSSAAYRIYQVPWLAGSAFVRLGAVW